MYISTPTTRSTFSVVQMMTTRLQENCELMMIVLTAALSFASLPDRYATLVPVVSAPQYYLHYPTSSPSPRHVAACWKCKTALGRPVRCWQHPPQRRHKGRRHVTRPLPPDQYSGNQAARPAAAPRLVLFSSSNCLIGSSQRALPTMAWGCLYLPPPPLLLRSLAPPRGGGTCFVKQFAPFASPPSPRVTSASFVHPQRERDRR